MLLPCANTAVIFTSYIHQSYYFQPPHILFIPNVPMSDRDPATISCQHISHGDWSPSDGTSRVRDLHRFVVPEIFIVLQLRLYHIHGWGAEAHTWDICGCLCLPRLARYLEMDRINTVANICHWQHSSSQLTAATEFPIGKLIHFKASPASPASQSIVSKYFQSTWNIIIEIVNIIWNHLNVFIGNVDVGQLTYLLSVQGIANADYF